MEEPLASGIHTLRIDDVIVDLLHDDRGGETLLVFFPSALTPSATWPYFAGAGIAERLGVSLLAFSDPSVNIPGVGTGWTLGDRRISFHRHVPRIIRSVACGRQVVMAGSSAGGFSAMHYNSQVEGSTAIAINPRTHLLMPPTAVQHASRRLYGTSDVAEIRALVPVEPEPSANRIIYVQNTGDHPYFSGQMVPWLLRHLAHANVWAYMDHWGDGHVALPRPQMDELVAAVIADPAAGGRGFKVSNVDQVLDAQAARNVARHVR